MSLTFLSPKPYLEKVDRCGRPTEPRQGYEPMDRNERTVEFPPEVVEEIRRRITSCLLRASPEPEPLYAKLAEWLGLSRDMLLLAQGSDAALRMAHECYAGPGDEVLSVTPSFAMYPVYARLAGAEPRQVRFRDDLTLPLEEILGWINRRTRVVVLANPNQPVERVFSDREIQTLLEACQRSGTMLVLDEAYHHFCEATALPRLKEYSNLIITRTFSKAFGMAGLRLGYLIARPEVVGHLSKLRPMYEVHSVAAAVGLYLLEHEEIMRDYVRQVREGLPALSEGLSRMGLKSHGGQSNALLAALPVGLPAAECARALKEKGFLVRAESEPPLTNHLRITVGPREQAERFLSALDQVISARRRAGRLLAQPEAARR